MNMFPDAYSQMHIHIRCILYNFLLALAAKHTIKNQDQKPSVTSIHIRFLCSVPYYVIIMYKHPRTYSYEYAYSSLASQWRAAIK